MNENISIWGESIHEIDEDKMFFELGLDVQEKDLMEFIDSYVLENNSIESLGELKMYVDSLIHKNCVEAKLLK